MIKSVAVIYQKFWDSDLRADQKRVTAIFETRDQASRYIEEEIQTNKTFGITMTPEDYEIEEWSVMNK